MGRFLLGIGLMLALLAAGLYVGHTAEDMHAPVSALLTEAAEAEAKAKEAKEERRRALELWLKEYVKEEK